MNIQSSQSYFDPALNVLPDALRDALMLSRQRRKRVARHDLITSTRKANGMIYLVSEGWAISELHLDTGERQILGLYGPGSFIGLEQEGETGKGYRVKALQDCAVYRIEASALTSAADRDPALAKWISAQRATSTQRLHRHIAALGQLSARGRLAFLMLRIVDIAQQTGASAVGKHIRLPMTQEEIGIMLGLTNVSISKLMTAFKAEELIDYSRNRITVLDTDALEALCGMSLENETESSARSIVGQPQADNRTQAA